MTVAGSNLHATVAVVGEVGILIRGASGAGKTRLALALIDDARARGRFARLVADDRVLVEERSGRLVARPHPSLAGLVERRGLGVGAVAHEPACVLGLAVDLVEGWPERMPAPGQRVCSLGGVVLPRLAVAARAPPSETCRLISASGVLAAPCAAGYPSPLPFPPRCTRLRRSRTVEQAVFPAEA